MGLRRLAAAERAALALLLLVGCAPSSPAQDDDGLAREPIVGGELAVGMPASGSILVERDGVASLVCSATAVTPKVVLTAAHCLDPSLTLLASSERFEPGEGRGATLDRATFTRCPTWDEDQPVHTGDLGLVRLESALDLRSFPRLRAAPIAGEDLGTTLLAVGSGRTSAEGGEGERRSLAMVLTANAGAYYSLRYPEPEPWRGLCYGDSGGGSFLPGPVRDLLYGVHSVALEGSCGPGADASVPRYLESFLRPAILELDPEAELCGDGLCTALEGAEGCPADCAPPGCGDAALDPGEVCDDGGNEDGDGCSADCASDESCGNGVVDFSASERCEPGGSASCSESCRHAPRCGDGVLDVEAPEGCDDGNLEAGDGCSPDCFLEGCGDGLVNPELGEECDDGDLQAGDGCSPDCSLEPGFTAGCACRAGGPADPGSATLRLAASLLLRATLP